MTNINTGSNNINIENLKAGLKIDPNNKLLKQYDFDGNSIFSANEIDALKRDIEKAAGDDKNLQRSESLRFFANKMNLSLDGAKKLFDKSGDLVYKSLAELNAQQEASEITAIIHEQIEDNFTIASIDKNEFQTAFNRITKDNILQVLDSYKERSKGESLSTAILREISASEQNRLNAVKKIYNLLLANIDKTKYDTSAIAQEFRECLKDKQVFANPERFDKIFNAMISMIEGSSVTGEQDLEKTTSNAQIRNKEAQTTVESKANSQGGVSKILDKISPLWGGDTQKDVEKAIIEHDAELKQLEALKNDPNAYTAKFKEIFGVNYSKDAIENYNQANTQYRRSLVLTQQQQIFDNVFKEELKNPEHSGITEAQYQKTYQKLSEMLGENLVDEFLVQAGADGKNISEKYKVLTNLIKEISNMNSKKALEATNGKTLEELKEARTDAYHAAYGFKKDTLLRAEEWVDAQQTRMTITKVGGQILAMAGAFTGVGSLALLSTAVMVTDPIGFAERATDSEGMTAEDWKIFSNERLENLGWMALGMGVGKAAKGVTDLVKLKGLSKLMQNSGKSLNDLLKNENLPAELALKVKSVTRLADTVGISSEVALDIVTTAMLQKDGLSEGDYLMSLAGALVGSHMQRNIQNLPVERQVSTVQNLFKDFNLSKEEAQKILNSLNDSQFVQHVKRTKDKIQEWGFFCPSTPSSKGSGAFYCGINPEEIVKAGKKAYNLAKSAINNGGSNTAKNLSPQERFQNIFGDNSDTANFRSFEKLMNKDSDMANALIDCMETMKLKIQNNEVPSIDMKQSVIDEMSQKYNIDGDTLADYIDMYMEESNNWGAIAHAFTKSEGYVNNHKDLYSDAIEDIKNMDKATVEAGQAATATPQEGVQTDVSAVNKETEITPQNTITKSPEITKAEETPVTKDANSPDEKNILSDELAEKYQDVRQTEFYGGSETEMKTIELLEKYEDLIKNEKMDYKNFDSTKIYDLISKNGISENDWDKVFNIIKNRFHQDVITEENRISGLQKQYNFSSKEESIAYSDNIINLIKDKQARGEKISMDEIDDMIYDNLPDQRDYDKIKKRIIEDSQIKNYINDNTHADVFENPEYTNIYSQEDLKQATKILDNILAEVRNGEDFDKALIDKYGAQGMVREALEKMLSTHWELGDKFNEIN